MGEKMKVHITNSSVSLRDKLIEIDEKFCKESNFPKFKEGTIDVETPDDYKIRGKNTISERGIWFPKRFVTVLPDVKDSLDKWL